MGGPGTPIFLTGVPDAIDSDPLGPGPNSSGQRPQSGLAAEQYGDPVTKRGILLDLPPDRCAKYAYKMWRDQMFLMQRRIAQWRANYLRRRGHTNVMVVKSQDRNMWTTWAPPMSIPSVPALNKSSRLCRRLPAMLLADPPVPEVSPRRGDDKARDQAEQATRVLRHLMGRDQLDGTQAAYQAVNRGTTYGSGFIWLYTHPQAAGRQAVEIKATQLATTVQDAMNGVLQGEPLMDRYVKPDGTLTDTSSEAALQWRPKICREILTGKQVRFLPHNCTSIEDALGVQIGLYLTWSEIVATWPDLASTDEATKKSVLNYRPPGAENLIPRYDEGTVDRDWISLIQDQQLAFVLVTYYKEHTDYPDGAYVVTIADKLTAYQGPWISTVNGERRPKDIPIAQFAQFDEGTDDPYSIGLMELLGPGNEVRAGQIQFLLDYLDKFNNRKIFIPTNSILQAKQFQLATHTVVPINPGGQPIYEEVPPFPKDALSLYEIMGKEMDDMASANDTSQAMENSDVQSGRQAMVIMGQVHANLSDLLENTKRGYCRMCRIALQLAREQDVPQKMGWEGEDGQYREEVWSGTDLVADFDVDLQTGTMSMLTPQAKATLVEYWSQLGVIPQQDVRDFLVGSVGGQLGLEDEPRLLRIRRQIARWKKGPPQGWQPPQPQMTPMGPQIPPDPIAMSVWDAVPADLLPENAMLRLWELNKLMQTTQYRRWPQPWRALVDQEFERMRQASGAQTVQSQGQDQMTQLFQQFMQGVQGMVVKSAEQEIAKAVQSQVLTAMGAVPTIAAPGALMPPALGAPRTHTGPQPPQGQRAPQQQPASADSQLATQMTGISPGPPGA